MAGVSFTHRSAKKLVDAARKVENLSPRDLQTRQMVARPTGRDIVFFEITGETDGEYSLKLMRYDTTSDAWEDDDRNITHDTAAVALNGQKGIPNGTIVAAWTVGRDDSGKTRWAFEAPDLRFDAIITGSTSDGDNRWEYDFAEAEVNADGTLSTKAGGRTGKAYNRDENGHTATIAWGIDTSLTDYPAGHAPRPIGAAGDSDTHDYNRGVEIKPTRDVNGDTIYLFSAFGTHDGNCDA